MSVEVAPLPKAAAVSGISGAVAAYWNAETLFVVVLPIIATWFGMVGLGVIDGKPAKHIARQVAGSILLGGVVGISAVTCIAMLNARGEFAAFVTLSIAMVPVAVSKAIGKAAPRIIDHALNMAGLQRRVSESKRDEDINSGGG